LVKSDKKSALDNNIDGGGFSSLTLDNNIDGDVDNDERY
jgi:hypothetical protein